MKSHISFQSNGLATLHGFPEITHIRVNKRHKLTILNLIKVKFFGGYPSLKPQILFYSYGLAIWQYMLCRSFKTGNWIRNSSFK